MPYAGKFFSPHRKKLKLFKENYSPDLLRKITYAGAHSTNSFEYAKENLKTLAEIDISTSHIQRLTIRIAMEFDEKESRLKDNWDKECIKQIDEIESPEVASISVDGGRAQIRKEDCGAGIHKSTWTETKVGCLQVLESKEVDIDPHPELPKIFQDKKSIKHMVEGLKGHSKKNIEVDIKDAPEEKKFNSKYAPNEKIEKDNTTIPKIIKKFVIADIDKAESFGHAIYQKAHYLKLDTAKRKAYLGDGDRKLWSIYEENFRAGNWTPILDFVHAVEYAFEGAKISTENENLCWAKYMEFVTHIWQGRILTVVRRLEKAIVELQNHAKNSTEKSKDKIDKLKSIHTYFQNNFTKMNYPLYRKKGLPISSCHVESLIKQFNLRIKSSEKFWNLSSVKGIIKIKASILSNDDSYQQFWNGRYDNQVKLKRHYYKSEQKLAA